MAWNEIVTLEWWQFALRWLHVIAGIMWIGHLWYFNFTQTPTLPKIPQEYRPGIARYILPEALWWFRWGAMATIVTGLILVALQHEFVATVAIGLSSHPHSAHFAAIGLGMWLGAIMWANVWLVIWPNQKKNLGLVQVPTPQRNRAARIATIASRVNTMLSIPMLYGMTSVHFY